MDKSRKVVPLVPHNIQQWKSRVCITLRKALIQLIKKGETALENRDLKQAESDVRAARRLISCTKLQSLSGGQALSDEFVESYLDKEKNGRLNIRLDILGEQVKEAKEAKKILTSSISINGSGGCIINSGSTSEKCTFSTNAVATKATKHGYDMNDDAQNPHGVARKRKRERKREDEDEEKEEGEEEETVRGRSGRYKRSKQSNKKRKVVVLDTNALMQSSDIIETIMIKSTKEASDIKMVVPYATVKELEGLCKSPKKRVQKMARRGNKAVNLMGKYMHQNRDADAISFQSIDEENEATATNTSKGSDLSNDDKILASAISEHKNSPSSDVFLLTNDINLQNKCFSSGIRPVTAKEFITEHMN